MIYTIRMMPCKENAFDGYMFMKKYIHALTSSYSKRFYLLSKISRQIIKKNNRKKFLYNKSKEENNQHNKI